MKTLALLAAAASWSAPQTVSAPHTFAGPLLVSSDQHGGALAAWGWQDGIGQRSPAGASHVRISGGTISAEQRAPQGLVAAQGYGNGRYVELASRQVDQKGQRWRLTVKDGHTTTRLATAFILFRPQLAVAPDGSAIVAWVEFHRHRQIVRAATRNATGRFWRPFTLAGRAHATTLTTAVSKRGDVLVAWVSDRRVIVRLRRPGGTWWSPDVMSSARVKTSWQLAAAFDDSARGFLVWRRHRFSRPGVPGITPLEAATVGPSATHWHASRTIERDGARDPALSPALPHGLVLTYIHGPNAHATARVRQSEPGVLMFGQPIDAAPPQGGVRSVSAVFDGASGLIVGWVIPNPSGDGAGIGYAADVSVPSPREQVTPSEAAFDMQLVRTSTGVRAFWTARPDGTGPGIPLSEIHTVVRTALRVPPAP